MVVKSLSYTGGGRQRTFYIPLTRFFHKRKSRVSTNDKRHIYLLILDDWTNVLHIQPYNYLSILRWLNFINNKYSSEMHNIKR